jgi:hypothetical protein
VTAWDASFLGCVGLSIVEKKGSWGKKALLWLAVSGLVGWAGKIWDKFRKLPDFPAQYEN